MRRVILGAILACFLPAACETDGSVGGLGDVLGGISGYPGGSGTSQGALSQAEIEAGLRQALEIGTERVASQIGVTDGYWADPKIRIPLPGRLGEAQRELARVGLSAPLDDLQLRMNRAAEDAVPAGKKIVIDAEIRPRPTSCAGEPRPRCAPPSSLMSSRRWMHRAPIRHSIP